jgi:hypothetical protein
VAGFGHQILRRDEVVGDVHFAAVRELVGLGLGHGPAIDLGIATVGVHHRVTLAVVLAHEVVDQTGEEDPEEVQHELRDVDVLGDSTGSHGVSFEGLCEQRP